MAAGAIIIGFGAPVVSAGAATRNTSTEMVIHALSTRSYGKILVDSKGYALYTYSRDTKNSSHCSGNCLVVWPALTVASGTTPLGKGVSGLGAIRRSDGTMQVTYHSLPLYTFASDAKPGQVTGQGVGGFSVAKVAKTASSPKDTTSGASNY